MLEFYCHIDLKTGKPPCRDYDKRHILINECLGQEGPYSFDFCYRPLQFIRANHKVSIVRQNNIMFLAFFRHSVTI